MAKRIKPKKKKSTNSGKLSPKKYIQTQARKLPLAECYITEGWKQAGMGDIVISRQHASGAYSVCVYLVDTFCLGVKDTFFRFNITSSEYREMVETFTGEAGLEPCEYALAHNVILGSAEYAESLGLPAHKDFAITEHFLEEDDHVEYLEIEFGHHGIPYLITRHDQPMKKEIAALNKTIGRENYKVGHLDAEGIVQSDDELDAMDRLMDRIDVLYETHFTDEVQAEELLFDTAKKYHINPNINFEHLDEEIIDRIEEVFEVGTEAPEEVIPLLKEAIEDHPNEPIFYNYLGSAYQDNNEEEKSKALTKSNYEQFSDYLLAKIPYFFLLLEEEKFSELDELIESKWDITLLMPEKEVFSLQEVFTYYTFMTNYALAKENIARASIYFNMLPDKDMHNENEQNIVFDLNIQLLNAKFKSLLGNDFDPENMEGNLEKIQEKIEEDNIRVGGLGEPLI